MRISEVFKRLTEEGPGLTRPKADSIKRSRYHHMKELRSGSLRVLFAFDPQRRAIVLTGGDKRNNWDRWYHQHIKIADRLYGDHLGERGRTTPWVTPPAGRKSAGREI
jgi:hypothetical protein